MTIKQHEKALSDFIITLERLDKKLKPQWYWALDLTIYCHKYGDFYEQV